MELEGCGDNQKSIEDTEGKVGKQEVWLRNFESSWCHESYARSQDLASKSIDRQLPRPWTFSKNKFLSNDRRRLRMGLRCRVGTILPVIQRVSWADGTADPPDTIPPWLQRLNTCLDKTAVLVSTVIVLIPKDITGKRRLTFRGN